MGRVMPQKNPRELQCAIDKVLLAGPHASCWRHQRLLVKPCSDTTSSLGGTAVEDTALKTAAIPCATQFISCPGHVFKP